jgi:hypothetical protein
VAPTAVVAALIVVLFGAPVARPAAGLDLPRIEMTDFAYGELRFATDADGRRWARLSNETELPHTFTAPSADVDVYVPSGRTAVVMLPAADGPLGVHCAIGDHEALGMVATVTP